MQTLQNCAVIHETGQTRPSELTEARAQIVSTRQMHCHRVSAIHSLNRHSQFSECRPRARARARGKIYSLIKICFFFFSFIMNPFSSHTFHIYFHNDCVSSIYLFHFRDSAVFAFSFQFHRSNLKRAVCRSCGVPPQLCANRRFRCRALLLFLPLPSVFLFINWKW